MKKILKWGGIIFIVIIVLSAFSDSDESSQGSSAPNQEESVKQVIYAVNNTINSNKLDLTITSVTEKASVGSQYLLEKASEGGILLVVNWQYKNTSKEPIGMFSQPSISLKDSNDVEYSSDTGKTSSYTLNNDFDSKFISDLNPGITVKDASVFEVSKESYAEGQWYVIVKADGSEYQVATR